MISAEHETDHIRHVGALGCLATVALFGIAIIFIVIISIILNVVHPGPVWRLPGGAARAGLLITIRIFFFSFVCWLRLELAAVSSLISSRSTGGAQIPRALSSIPTTQNE